MYHQQVQLSKGPISVPNPMQQQQQQYKQQPQSFQQQLQQQQQQGILSQERQIIYGVEIPNRVFVGGVAYDTTELELKTFFQSFGEIKDAKIITDRDGISKGYGFITFDNEKDAAEMQTKKTIYFKEKKLNIGPAIRKQGGQFPKANQEFINGQIKVFINSSSSPVYTQSSNDKIPSFVYSLSPTHYVSTIPYYHHQSNSFQAPRFPPPTNHNQILPVNPQDATHLVYPFQQVPPSGVSNSPPNLHPSAYEPLRMFQTELPPAPVPPTLSPMQTFQIPRYPTSFILPHEHLFHDNITGTNNTTNTANPANTDYISFYNSANQHNVNNNYYSRDNYRQNKYNANTIAKQFNHNDKEGNFETKDSDIIDITSSINKLSTKDLINEPTAATITPPSSPIN